MDAGFEAEALASGSSALERLEAGGIDALVTDLRMNQVSGLDLLAASKRASPQRPVIVMTAYGAIDTAVESIRQGAYHYLTKPFQPEELVIFLRRALEERNLQQEARLLRRGTARAAAGDGMIGTSPGMREVTRAHGAGGRGGRAGAAARRDRHRQEHGGRGHPRPQPAARGALRGGQLRRPARGAAGERTVRPREGRLHRRHLGPPGPVRGGRARHHPAGRDRRTAPGHPGQAAARAGAGRGAAGGLQPGAPVDVRIIAATHRDLPEMARPQKFREDLLYRLDVVAIEIPALRHRREDILPLVEHFLETFRAKYPDSPVTGFTPAALRRLMDYPWPGNVRELAHLVQRMVVLGRAAVADLEDLPPGLLQDPRPPRTASASWCRPGNCSTATRPGPWSSAAGTRAAPPSAWASTSRPSTAGSRRGRKGSLREQSGGQAQGDAAGLSVKTSPGGWRAPDPSPPPAGPGRTWRSSGRRRLAHLRR